MLGHSDAYGTITGSGIQLVFRLVYLFNRDVEINIKPNFMISLVCNLKKTNKMGVYDFF